MPEDDEEQPQLPLIGVGPQLKDAREKAGISRAEIAAKTRISERVVAQMEAGNFAALPSRTYAIGFTRSYARAVGLDDNIIIETLRRELGYSPPAETSGESSSYEPGDPARVPSARIAWWVALAALLLVAGGLYVWRNYYAPSVSLPAILPEDVPTIEPTFVTEAVMPSDAASLDASAAPNPAFTFAPPPQPQIRLNQPRRTHSRPAPNGSATLSPSATPSAASPAAVAPPQTSTVSN